MEDSSSGQADSLSLTNSTIGEPFTSSTQTTATNIDDLQEETGTIKQEGYYKLRALNETNNISAFEADWLQAPQLPASLNVSSLSSELVNETLNYFVNCGRRLSQMTKTYDDNDAYILLLQEKEVDLELAARIGQNLLIENKELKNSVANLKEELEKRQDHVQQLKHDLASKTALLDTFIEEEENQSSLEESEQLYTATSTTNHSRCQDQPQPSQSQQPNSNKHSSQPVVVAGHDFNYDEDRGQNGFLSLNYSSPKPSSCIQVEPFSSLPYYMNLNTPAENSTTTTSFKQQHHHHYDQRHDFNEDADSNSSTLSREEEELDRSTCPVFGAKTTANADSKQEIIKTVTFQLVESNKRLCELQDEIFYKSEQNSMQQEKILTLQEQLKESDRRLRDVASENVTLLNSMDETKEIHKELTEELRICKRNFNELLRVFLAIQKESRLLRNETIQRNSTLNYLGEEEIMIQDDDFVNATYHSFTPISTTKPNPYNINHTSPPEPLRPDSQSGTNATYVVNSRTNISASPSLLEELQETLRNNNNNIQSKTKLCQSTDEESENGDDSGVITNNNNNSTSATPTTYTLTDTETEDRSQVCDNSADGSGSWLSFSSFVITTILLLCLSVTFRSSSNGSLPRKLQLKLD